MSCIFDLRNIFVNLWQIFHVFIDTLFEGDLMYWFLSTLSQVTSGILMLIVVIFIFKYEQESYVRRESERSYLDKKENFKGTTFKGSSISFFNKIESKINETHSDTSSQYIEELEEKIFRSKKLPPGTTEHHPQETINERCDFIKFRIDRFNETKNQNQKILNLKTFLRKAVLWCLIMIGFSLFALLMLKLLSLYLFTKILLLIGIFYVSYKLLQNTLILFVNTLIESTPEKNIFLLMRLSMNPKSP